MKICLLQYPVGLQKILQLLTSEDSDVQVHAVKVVANLAAEGVHSSPRNPCVIDWCLFGLSKFLSGELFLPLYESLLMH